MKIAYITSHINKSLQWYWFSEELVKRNIQHFHIILNEYEPILARDLKELGVEVYYLKHKNFLSHLINLFKVILILKKHSVDLVHTSLPYGNLIGQLAALLTGIQKRVTTCENASWAHDFNSKKQKIIDRLTFWSAKKVIAVSDTAREYLETKWKIKPEKLTTIYHGLKITDYDNTSKDRILKLKKRLGIQDQDFIIGVIARFEYWKGHIYIVEAIRKIVKEHPEVKLLIFGSQGPEYEKIMEKVKEYNLSHHVFYKGFIEDPIALFQLLDIHVHVPINKYVETGGINIIEGMISERPQILTRSGYAFTTAQHMSNCMVVDYGDSDQIAEAILKLKGDPELRKNLARQARLDAIRLFNNQLKVERHLDLYERL